MGGRYLFESFPADPVFLHAVVTSGGEIELMSVLNPDGTLSIYRGFYVEEIKGPTAAPLLTDTFYRLGFTWFLDPTNGVARIWNGSSVLLGLANGATEPSGFPWSGIVWGLPENCALSHYYWGDNYGHQPTIIPSFFVRNLTVDSDGAFQEWPATAGSRADVLNVAPPDFLETLQAPANLARFSQKMATLPSVNTIYLTQTTALVRNVDAPNASHRPTLELDGVSDDGFPQNDYPDPAPVDTDWRRVYRIDYQNPSNGGGWSPAGVDAMRFGGQVLDAD